jgi:hypothetical protein
MARAGIRRRYVERGEFGRHQALSTLLFRLDVQSPDINASDLRLRGSVEIHEVPAIGQEGGK